jgi:putative transposase
MRNYDYASEGWYFITICTKGMKCFLGNIENGIMASSQIGVQSEFYWEEIPKHFPQIELGEFVIMPNHIHGMIAIHDDNARTAVACGTAVACNGPTLCNGPTKDEHMAFISPKSGTVSAIVRSYKSAVSKWCTSHHYTNFKWHYRFHDHIIRNQDEFDRIENYILANIENWGKDKFYNMP